MNERENTNYFLKKNYIHLRIGNVFVGVLICDNFSRKSSLNDLARLVKPLLPFILFCLPIGL